MHHNTDFYIPVAEPRSAAFAIRGTGVLASGTANCKGSTSGFRDCRIRIRESCRLAIGTSRDGHVCRFGRETGWIVEFGSTPVEFLSLSRTIIDAHSTIHAVFARIDTNAHDSGYRSLNVTHRNGARMSTEPLATKWPHFRLSDSMRTPCPKMTMFRQQHAEQSYASRVLLFSV